MALSQTVLKTRVRPRLSATTIASFMVAATSSARQRILYNSKFPPAEIVLHYGPAVKAAKDYLVSGLAPSEILTAIGRQNIRRANSKTQWSKTDAALCAEVIALLPNICPKICPGSTFQHFPTQAALTIRGVSVSVQPHALCIQASRLGGVFFMFSQGLDEDKMRYLATLLFLQLRLGQASLYTPDRQLCVVASVRHGRVVSADKCNVQRHWSEIQAACASIASIWGSITP